MRGAHRFNLDHGACRSHASGARHHCYTRDSDCRHPGDVKISRKSISRTIEKDQKTPALDGYGYRDPEDPKYSCSTNEGRGIVIV